MLWPSTVSIPSAGNWLDHFPGSSLDARWTALTSGTGAVTVTDSYCQMASGGSGGAAGIYWTTKLDKTKNILIQACMSGQHTSGASRAFEIHNKATAPTATTDALQDPNRRLGLYLLGGGSADSIYCWYNDLAHSEVRWDGAWTPSGSFAAQPVSADNYYILGLEIDGKNSRFRMLAWNRDRVGGGSLFDQGLRLWALTDWVAWTALEATTDLWLVLGTPATDWAVSKTWRCEWVRYAEDTLTMVETWVASKDALGDGHKVRHGWSHDGVIFVPQDRTTIALDVTATSWESGEIQSPSVCYDGVNTDYMAYTGMSGDFSESGIGIAKATHAVPQNGPWTRGVSNPVLSPGAGEDRIRYSFLFKDDFDPDANKRWKLVVPTRFTSDGKQRLQLATAPDPPDTATWTRQGTIVDVGTGSDLDVGGIGDGAAVAFVHGRWDVFYEGVDSGGLSRVLRATGPTLTALTKEAGVAYIAHQANGDSALTANLTASRTVTVASTTGFTADSFVLVDQDTDYDLYGASRIRKVVNSTTLELYHELDGFTTTLPAHIRQIDRSPHQTPRCVIRVGNEWWFFSVNWGFMDGDTGINALCEQVVLYTHAGERPSTMLPSLVRLADPVLTRSEFGARRSAENFSLFNQPLRYPPQIVYPIADVTDGTWLNAAASNVNLYQSVDEPEITVDQDYIQSASGPSADLVELGFGPLADPLVGTGHILRYRIRLDTAGRNIALTTELRQGANALSTPASFSDTLSSTTEATIAQVLSAAQADAITDYKDLHLRVSATQSAGSSPTLVAAGTAAFTATNAATITPGLPAGWAAGDIHILIAARGDNTAMTSLSGWTNLSAQSGNNTIALRTEIWWRRAVAGDTAPVVTFGSGTVVRGARIIGVRGCVASGSPFDTNLSILHNAASATVTFTDVSSTVATTFALALWSYEDDPSTAATMSGFTQPASSVSTSSLGTDLSLGYQHKAVASVGAVGASTLVISGGTFANSPNSAVILVLKPVTTAARLVWSQLEVPYSPLPAVFPPRTITLRR